MTPLEVEAPPLDTTAVVDPTPVPESAAAVGNDSSIPAETSEKERVEGESSVDVDNGNVPDQAEEDIPHQSIEVCY